MNMRGNLGILQLILYSMIIAVCVSEEDLYRVLGVKKTASDGEIKKAYKRLAREWHPDKNKEEGATEKFMKINEAYETLSDKDKRQQYDNFGTTSAQAEQRNPFQQGNPFEQFFHGSPFQGFRFNFGERESPFAKHRITLRAFQTSVLPESRERPFLLFSYSGFCYDCMEVEMIWDRLVSDAETTGMGIGTIHAQLDHALANRARSPPGTMSVAIGGKLRYYAGRISVPNIRQFIRNLLPQNLITRITDENYQEFLEGWSDNRVRALIFGDREDISMRFLIPAYAYRERIAVGYINTASLSSRVLQGRFSIPALRETLLMFNEETDTPMSTLSTSKLAYSSISDAFETNKYLILPRLSNQRIFMQLCPMSPTKKNKRLCVVLLTRNVPEHDPHRESFRRYAHSHPDPHEQVRYAYIYEDTQPHFVSHITRGTGITNDTNLKVVVLSRTEQGGKVRYEIMDEGWPGQEDMTRSGRRLHRMVDWFLQGSDMLPFSFSYPHDLIDEQAESLLVRVHQRLQDYIEMAYEKIISLDEMTVITCLLTVGLIVVTGFVMHTLSSMEQQNLKAQAKAKKNRGSGPRHDLRPTVYMHELNSDTFTQLVMESPPGVRVIVVLVDEERKSKLLQQFAHFLLPYSRGEAFKFTFLELERYLPWYRTLLERTLDFKRDLSGINIKNCVGTVLSLNGPRKYYCIYHAQERHFRRKNQPNATGDSGSFLGFDGSDSSGEEYSPDDDKIFESDLLNGMGTWMERLCEGTLRRFRLDQWPSMAEHST